jgi:hypothetical protein
LAAFPGDRILRSRIRIRSRILGSNHFAFPSLAALRIWSGFGLSALPLRVAAWRANDLWPRTRHPLLPLTGRSSSSPTTSSIAATTAPSLPLRKSISPAPHVRSTSALIFSTYAPRLERVLLTRGEEGLHIKILGHIPCASSGSRDRFPLFPPPQPPNGSQRALRGPGYGPSRTQSPDPPRASAAPFGIKPRRRNRPTYVFAHAAHGPRYHRRSHQGDLFFQLTILGFNSG